MRMSETGDVRRKRVRVLETEACDENVSQTLGPGMRTTGTDVGGCWRTLSPLISWNVRLRGEKAMSVACSAARSLT